MKEPKPTVNLPDGAPAPTPAPPPPPPATPPAPRVRVTDDGAGLVVFGALLVLPAFLLPAQLQLPLLTWALMLVLGGLARGLARLLRFRAR